jgi:hypothetical protein
MKIIDPCEATVINTNAISTINTSVLAAVQPVVTFTEWTDTANNAEGRIDTDLCGPKTFTLVDSTSTDQSSLSWVALD